MTAIETTLVGHPGVTEAAVIAEPMASGDHRLVAYVVPASAASSAAGALRDFAAGRLPDYVVPSAFVTLEALPLTHTGKIDRRRLPDVRKVRPVLACALISPRSPLETALAALWAEVLELDAVGIHDPFVELGGSSLLAFAIAARIRTTWGVALSRPRRPCSKPRRSSEWRKRSSRPSLTPPTPTRWPPSFLGSNSRRRASAAPHF